MVCRSYRCCGKDFSDKPCRLHVHCDSLGRVYAVLLSGLVRNNSKDALLLLLKMVVIEISNISAVSERLG